LMACGALTSQGCDPSEPVRFMLTASQINLTVHG
jgi:hypothetical protein